MRKREPRPSKRARLSVRFAANDLADLQFMALCLGGLFFKRLLTDIALEVISQVQTGIFALDEQKLLSKIRANPDARAACKRLHDRGIRNLPNAATVPTWIPLEPDERALVLRVSQQTRWSAAQVILEAIYAGIALASAEHALVTLPSFIRVYRSVTVFEPDMAELVQDQINTALGFLPERGIQTGSSGASESLSRIKTWLKVEGATNIVSLNEASTKASI